MATDLTPVRSDFEIEDHLLLHGADVDDANINSDNDSLPPLEDILKIPDPKPVYDLRKRTERNAPLTFIDQDKSGNFDPEEEQRKVNKSRQLSRVRRRKLSNIRNATKDKAQSQAKRQSLIPSPSDTSSCKVPTVKVSKSRNNAKSHRPVNPLRPEDYLTKEDFKYFEDSFKDSENLQLASRPPSPEVLEDSAGHKGVITKIKTSFTHPIEFDVEYATTDCNFCQVSTYGFFGSFEKEKYCIRWDNGLGFTQLTGGDAETTATTMCQTCTMERVQVVLCESHEIHCVNPSTLNFEEALENLITAEEPATIKEQLLQWCSMCFSPAEYACCQRQESLLTVDGEVEGCGLKLCAACETKLREVFGGDVHAMAAAFDQESKAKVDDEDFRGKVRADVGFLCRDGILVLNVENATEESADEEVSV